uniref:Amino acid transporter transmembrane domain-containing protein n=1 Tax=Haptolina ericina TaxID=156174 RepID=A0A7S3APB8_9EUKA|mmetsp:Transcript_28744/g.65093  ORF Transcript_28744/g.65093 Transcript_28744/m.65093 type:complete len:304 (+) Transcript_28744:153-1064(+)
MQVPSFHDTRYAALWLGLAPLVINVGVFFYEVLLVQPWSCEPGPSFTQPSARRLFTGFAAFTYAFGGHGLYPEQIREMSEPSNWARVMSLTYSAVIPLYWACGILGYGAYGDFAKANINLNFPHNRLNMVSLAIQIVQELFFVLESNLVLLLAIELRLKIDPSRIFRPLWRGIPPVLARLVLRTGFLAAQVVIAQMLLSGEGDTLLALQGLIGAVGMAAFTYCLPFVLQTELSTAPLSFGRKCWNGTNIAIGGVVMLAGLWSSLSDLIEASPGIFAGACRLPFAYAPESEADPCHVSGIRAGW